MSQATILLDRCRAVRSYELFPNKVRLNHVTSDAQAKLLVPPQLVCAADAGPVGHAPDRAFQNRFPSLVYRGLPSERCSVLEKNILRKGGVHESGMDECDSTP